MSYEEKLAYRLMANIQVDAIAGCWLWQGALNRGYGAIWAYGGAQLAHRMAYKVFKGSVPDELLILHTCDIRSCINPHHLYIGTYVDNMRDLRARGSRAEQILNGH